MFKFDRPKPRIHLAAFVLGVTATSTDAFAIVLSPQEVVNIAMKQAPAVKQAELNSQVTEGAAEQLRGPYDLIWRLSPKYTYTEAQNLAGTANPVDKTWNIETGFAKTFSTGTRLDLSYNRISQESELSAFSTNLRSPTSASDGLTLALRQPLWKNSFGEGDRAILENASATMRLARMQREEGLETAVLDSLSLYWNAYVAEVQLRENTAARTKYEELVKAVRRKAGFNLSSPGELPRLEAELYGADSRVKVSSQEYLRTLDLLRTNLQLPSAEPVTFSASATEPKDIPEIPKLRQVSIENLRPLASAKITYENAERSRTSAFSSARPQLDLVASANSTGVDQKNDLSFSKMTSASNPTYVVGFELLWPLDSSSIRGIRAEAEAKYGLAQIEYKLAQDRLRDNLADAERKALAYRDAAISSIDIVTKRGRVVREFEVSYRQGRTPLVELIRAFNELFEAQLARARAVGNYMNALNQWAALRDELVKGAQL